MYYSSMERNGHCCSCTFYWLALLRLAHRPRCPPFPTSSTNATDFKTAFTTCRNYASPHHSLPTTPLVEISPASFSFGANANDEEETRSKNEPSHRTKSKRDDLHASAQLVAVSTVSALSMVGRIRTPLDDPSQSRDRLTNRTYPLLSLQ